MEACPFLLVFYSYSDMDALVQRRARHMSYVLCSILSS